MSTFHHYFCTITTYINLTAVAITIADGMAVAITTADGMAGIIN